VKPLIRCSLYTSVRSRHRRFEMLARCILVNSKITQVVRQGILHRIPFQIVCVEDYSQGKEFNSHHGAKLTIISIVNLD